MTCGNSGLTRLLGFASDRVIEKITTWVRVLSGFAWKFGLWRQDSLCLLVARVPDESQKVLMSSNELFIGSSDTTTDTLLKTGWFKFSLSFPSCKRNLQKTFAVRLKRKQCLALNINRFEFLQWSHFCSDAYCATTCCKMRGLYTWALIMKVNGKQFRKQLSDSAHQGPEWVAIFPGPDELAALEESCLQEASEVRGNRQLVLDVGWWVIYMHRSVP